MLSQSSSSVSAARVSQDTINLTLCLLLGRDNMILVKTLCQVKLKPGVEALFECSVLETFRIWSGFQFCISPFIQKHNQIHMPEMTPQLNMPFHGPLSFQNIDLCSFFPSVNPYLHSKTQLKHCCLGEA